MILINQISIKFLSFIYWKKGMNLIQYIIRAIAYYNATRYDNIMEIKTIHCRIPFFNICYTNHEDMLTYRQEDVNSRIPTYNRNN